MAPRWGMATNGLAGAGCVRACGRSGSLAASPHKGNRAAHGLPRRRGGRPENLSPQQGTAASRSSCTSRHPAGNLNLPPRTSRRVASSGTTCPLPPHRARGQAGSLPKSFFQHSSAVPAPSSRQSVPQPGQQAAWAPRAQDAGDHYLFGKGLAQHLPAPRQSARRQWPAPPVRRPRPPEPAAASRHDRMFRRRPQAPRAVVPMKWAPSWPTRLLPCPAVPTHERVVGSMPCHDEPAVDAACGIFFCGGPEPAPAWRVFPGSRGTQRHAADGLLRTGCTR